MQRYFALNNDLTNITLSKDDVFHISHVMRMKKNDLIEVVIDNKLYLCNITSFNPFNLTLKEELSSNSELKTYIRLLYCLPKGNKIDLVLQKSTELGVDEIVLINSERSVAKISNDNKGSKLIRFNKILKEASEQSKRIKIPILKDIIDFKDIKNYPSDLKYIAYENTTYSQKDFFLELKKNKINNKTINIIIGSEGGISLNELEISKNNGYKEISLGNRILRSETSVLYLLSILSFLSDIED